MHNNKTIPDGTSAPMRTTTGFAPGGTSLGYGLSPEQIINGGSQNASVQFWHAVLVLPRMHVSVTHAALEFFS